MKWDAEKYDATKAPQIDAGRELIALAGIREEDSILDLGCGTGKLTIELARLARNGSVVGLDPSPKMLDKAQEVSSGMKNVRLVQVPAQAMNFADEFDLVFSNSALHWVKEQEHAVSRVYHSLRKGGRIAFQMPVRNFCAEFFDSIGEAITSLGYERFYEGWSAPWHFPANEEYASVLSHTGFRAVKVYSKEYHLCFGPLSDVVNWWSSAGLRPYLAALPEGAQEHFKEAFGEGFERRRTDKGIEFDFRRLFAFAEK
jgi:trans-aconitate 2-methyltransferase